MTESFNVHKPDLDPIPPSDMGDSSQSRPPRKTNWRSSYKGILSVIELFAGALLLAFIINQFVFQSYEVFGQSMSPTLVQGDRLIISKMSRSWNSLWRKDYSPSTGEVIVFHNPRSPSTQLVKRVVGMPGDRVVVASGTITVYNQENPNGYNPDVKSELELAPGTEGNIDITVPEGEIFVVGDNRLPNASYDSRSHELGTIPIDEVVGELILRVFPLDEAKFF